MTTGVKYMKARAMVSAFLLGVPIPPPNRLLQNIVLFAARTIHGWKI